MCKFLTGPARIEQTERRRTWKLLDNEVFKANDGCLYLAPRNMLSDNYSIPLFVAWIAGSPVDFDTRCSHIHDFFCYTHEALMIDLTEKELRDMEYLRYSEKNKMWICENIPEEYLETREIKKFEANNIFYECMETTNVPLMYRILIRLGVIFNLNWYLGLLFKKVFKIDLEKVYDEDYWKEKIDARRYRRKRKK